MHSHDNEFWCATSADAAGMEMARKKRISRPVQLTFQALDTSNEGLVSSNKLISELLSCGLHIDSDPRLAETYAKLQSLNAVHSEVQLNLDMFASVTYENISLINKAISGCLVVSDFQGFCANLIEVFDAVKENRSGNVAQYIPELRSVDPDLFAIAVCTVDGQTWAHGDFTTPFSVQSTAKPISYMMAVQEKGLDYVHQRVGREPSGQPFNSLSLKSCSGQPWKAVPHNPMINSGAIMVSALLMEGQESMSERFKSLLAVWRKLFGGVRPDFSNSTYLSEKETANRNWCLSYMMLDAGCFSSDTNPKQVLDFYFQTCAIEATTQKMATLAASMATGGVNPFTHERIFKADTVKNCLSLMLSTGMYDFSGEWQFSVGVPAKSGVSGIVYLVIPNFMGIAIYSPRLDDNGNSARAIQFAQSICKIFKFHMFDSVVSHEQYSKEEKNIRDPRQASSDTVALLFSAAAGDIKELQRLIGRGNHLDVSDYDSRTALHLSAAEGSLDCVKYICSCSDVEDLSPMDRWGRTPLDDAIAGHHEGTAKFLQSTGALTGDELRRRQRMLESTPKSQTEVLLSPTADAVDALTSMIPLINIDHDQLEFSELTPKSVKNAEDSEERQLLCSEKDKGIKSIDHKEVQEPSSRSEQC
uniref:glutaminase n=1 Tax=Spongospora subterranea TaxID=70186 RepID=A0A0H5R0R5_9EUKA|eukprot:CRZ01374.1 hypothetical protein [Spongospora subterranea]